MSASWGGERFAQKLAQKLGLPHKGCMLSLTGSQRQVENAAGVDEEH
jgi:hypothetical protein